MPTTSFVISITKETGHVYAKSLGVTGYAGNAFGAVSRLMELLATKLVELEGAAKHNALSDAATKEMVTLRGIFHPKEEQIAPISMVCKK